jgi:DNA-binding MarR family transcriptional regulator
MDRMRVEERREAIANALERATALVVRHLREPGDLSLTSAAVLGTLRAEGPVRLTVLAATAGVSQPATTQLVQRLEVDGLASRTSDPEDGRGTLVAITDAGLALLAEVRRERRERLGKLLGTLSIEDEATLVMAMDVALPVLEQLIDATAPRRVTSASAPSRSPGAACEHSIFDAGLSTTANRRSAVAQPAAHGVPPAVATS